MSFPKPFLLGQAYGSSVERALDYATKRDPNAVAKWIQGTMTQLPITWEAIVPTAGKPILEAWANKSFFRGTPLETQAMQNLPPAMRFTPSSSLLSRQISNMLPSSYGVSPVKIDNTIRGVFAGLGKYGTDAIDWGLVKLSIADIAPPPARTASELPVLRGFLNSPYQPSAWVQRFYDAAKDAEQLVAGARKAPELLESKEQDQFYKDNVGRLSHYAGSGGALVQIRKAEQQLADVHKAMVLVQNDKTMPGEAKREKLLQLGQVRDTIAEQAFKGLIAPTDQGKFR
jgi:hypothetical protein